MTEPTVIPRLCVACVLVRGNVPFSTEYVRRLASMVRGRGDMRDVRIVCLTDQPRSVERWAEPIEIPSPPAGVAGWWSKLELFSRKHDLGDVVTYLDLDVLVILPLLSMIAAALNRMEHCDAPMALIPHAGNFRGRDGLTVIPKFNSSVMVYNRIGCHRLHDDFSQSVTRRLWGDQDWIAERIGDEVVTMPLEWFPRVSEITRSSGDVRVPPEARVVLCKKPKNHEAAERWPQIAELWQ